MAVLLEDALPVVKHNGLNTAKAVTMSGTNTLSGATTISGALTTTSTVTQTGGGASSLSGTLGVTGVTTPTGGVAVASGTADTVFHTAGVGAGIAAFGTDTTPVTTESYYCEVFIPHNATLTGLSVLNGTAVSGNIQVGLANSAGAVVASSASTTSGSGTNAYQQIPFSTTYAAVGPAKYFAVVQYSATTARYRVHVLGNVGAAAKTSQTYGTLTSGYTTTTFATAGAIVADTY